LRDAPAQVDLKQVDLVVAAALAKHREDSLDEHVALRVHIHERRRDEDARGLPLALAADGTK